MNAPQFRDAIADLDLSQRALAERLGLAISTVNRMAVGKSPVPRYVQAYLELLGSMLATTEHMPRFGRYQRK